MGTFLCMWENPVRTGKPVVPFYYDNMLHAANMPAMKAFIVNGVGAMICALHLLYRA